jgi:predicted RNA polymerase sigma factor
MSTLEPGSIERPLDVEVPATLIASHRLFLSFLEQRVESLDAAEEILQAALAKAVEKGGARVASQRPV